MRKFRSQGQSERQMPGNSPEERKSVENNRVAGDEDGRAQRRALCRGCWDHFRGGEVVKSNASSRD